MLDEQIRRNQRRTFGLYALLFVVFMGFALGIGGIAALARSDLHALYWAVAVMVPFFLLYSWTTTRLSKHTILRAARARPANPGARSEKLLLNCVEELAIAAAVPTPKVFIQQDADINAFAAGRNPSNAFLCVSTGALAKLKPEELQGVVAHEIAHIRNHDVRVTTVAVAVVGLFALLYDVTARMSSRRAPPVIVLLYIVAALSYVFGRLTYLALSRQREYLADATGAHLARNPNGLVSALRKLSLQEPQADRGDRTVAALYFDNPFRRLRRDSLWSSHPPLATRIARLGGRPVGQDSLAWALDLAERVAPSIQQTPDLLTCPHCCITWHAASPAAMAHSRCPDCGRHAVPRNILLHIPAGGP